MRLKSGKLKNISELYATLKNITEMRKLLKIKRIILISIVWVLYVRVSAQDISLNKNEYPAGITFRYGLGSFALKDHYISNEKYSGKIQYLSVNWARKHEKYAYRLMMEYRNSDEIKNFNVSSSITQFSLNQGFLYLLKERKFLNKDLNLYLGPMTELFFFYNKPDIAVGGFDYAQSVAALFSAGIEFAGIYHIGSAFQIESSIYMTGLSLGFRMVDSEEDNQSPVKLLSLLSGLNGSFDLGIRYNVLSHFSIIAGYRFELCRISKWEPLTTASDNLVAGLNWNF